MKTMFSVFVALVIALVVISNANARYYDPIDGVFISKDPIGYAGGDVNLYRYTGNNPINYTDPSGLAVFENAEELTNAGNTAITLYPKVGKQTYCSHGVRYIERTGGNNDYSGMRANDIINMLSNPQYGTQISAEEAVAYAKKGVTVIAGIQDQPSGHVAIVAPADLTKNKKWGSMPSVFNVGKVNGVMPINESFRLNNRPKYYIRNEDM